MKTPDYVLMEAIQMKPTFGNDLITIPAGSFVRPIELTYIPQSIKDDPRWRIPKLDMNEYVFCYTVLGIIPIPRKIVRQV